MVRSHERSPSPAPADGQPALLKRMKLSHPADTDEQDVDAHFAPEVLAPATIHRLHTEYEQSAPFKHALVDKLFQDELLHAVKDEALAELSFSEKETDIYKVKQTGDLASLSFLTDAQRALLPHLLTLRNALYSARFRAFLRAVTGCGPLSGTKQDMSVTSYSKSCHLLNHDDVIGSRRVSYILYMPLPHYMGWQREWGGALELYPTRDGPDGVPEPEPVPSKSVSPSWNQFIFFEVQPGRSFHSVEEVVVGEGEDGRERLSISGWFHAAQPGEEGYVPEPEPELRSSREQLTSTSTEFSSYPDSVDPSLPDDALSESDVAFLSEYLNPVYLQPRTMKALASRFLEESSLELHDFLCGPLAAALDAGLRDTDAADGLGPGRPARIPSHTAGADGAWGPKGPPHKWRYCTLRAPQEQGARSRADPPWAHAAPDEAVRALQDTLFPSAPFRAWLAAVSRLLPLRYAVEARRFRPGLDYTLATSEAKETRLDVVLGLTPQVGKRESEGGAAEEVQLQGWQTGEWGGWECYMAPHDEEDDPAVYRSGSQKTQAGQPANGHENGGATNGHAQNGHGHASDGSDYDMSDDEDDGTLLTVQPGFNRLLLVLRDEGVMRFVKYVSAAAEGSRWDVCGEFEIGLVQQEEEA
ncbi:hypothetical protein AcW1_004377 [Taiwanofungus camphoratus]|nr:hypothetical protein AcW1_004377 [Antrodia cinnamomea]